MTAEELLRTIGQLLEPELGFYTLSGGTEVRALVLLHSGDKLADRQVSGLEVVVRAEPVSSTPEPMFDGIRRRETWQVYLCQWQGNRTVTAARQKLEQYFPGARAVVVPIEKNLEMREQISVKIPSVSDGEDWITVLPDV